MNSAPTPAVHSAALRAYHWLNALTIVLMTLSGWKIYNASPIWNFRFPNEATLGGWLGGALQWHFAFMWLLVLNTSIYLLVNLVSGRLRSKFFPISHQELFTNVRDALRGRLAHTDINKYNAVQRLAYLFVLFDLALIVASGLVLWKSVQFPLLRELMGGYEMARRVHFVAMAGLVAFFVVHIAMALLVPKTIVAMIKGRA